MRLFVALDVPDDVRRRLAAVMDHLKPKCLEARWVRPESMHLTLKFIGHVIADGDTAKLAELRAALSSVRSNQPVALQFCGIGFFPNPRRPRVVWCGVQASPNLAQLAAEIDRALERLGVAREKRGFVPHLTLARMESPRAVETLVRAARELESTDFGSARENQFYLFESKLKPAGAEYAKIETCTFAGDAA